MATEYSTRRTTPAPQGADSIDEAEAAAQWQQISANTLDDSTRERLEAVAAGNAIGVQRRVCLVVVSQTLEALEKISIEEPEVFAETLELAEAFHKHAQGLASVAQAAVLRLRLADPRTL